MGVVRGGHSMQLRLEPLEAHHVFQRDQKIVSGTAVFGLGASSYDPIRGTMVWPVARSSNGKSCRRWGSKQLPATAHRRELEATQVLHGPHRASASTTLEYPGTSCHHGQQCPTGISHEPSSFRHA